LSSSEQTKAQPAQPQVFVRESTGLVKNASFFDTIALNLSNMSIGALLGTFGLYGYLIPSIVGLNFTYTCIFGFVVAVPQIVIYTMMTQRFPRTGGDYIWISRTFGGFWGSSLSFMGYTLETTAYLALIVLSAVFAIGAVGYIQSGFTNGTFLGLSLPGNSGGTPLPQFEVGALIFAVLILINVFKPKAGFKLVSALTIFGVATLLIAIFTLLWAGHSAVVNYVNSAGWTAQSFSPHEPAFANSSLNYNTIVGAFQPSSNWLTPALFLLPLVFAFVYPWVNAAPAVASEIKGRTALKWNVPISAVIALVLVTSSFATLYYVGGIAFINEAFASWSISVYYTFNFWTLAMGVAGNTYLAWLIGLGWIVWNVGILAYGIIVISRYLLAQSFDRFLPAKISYVSPRFGSPMVAQAISLIVTVTLVGLAAFYYGTVSALFGAIIAAMIYFIFIGLTATAHALKKETGSARAILSVAGLLNIVVFGYVAWEFAANPTVWSLNTLTYGFVIFSFILGAAIYLTSKNYYKRKGIDISLAYKELPPE
jgi:amino acid transporter